MSDDEDETVNDNANIAHNGDDGATEVGRDLLLLNNNMETRSPRLRQLRIISPRK